MTAPSDYEALVEKAATVLRDEVIDAPRAAIIATRALEAIGLPALLGRVEAAEALLDRNGARHCLCSRAERARGAVRSVCPHHGEPLNRQRDALAAKVADAGERIALAIEAEQQAFLDRYEPPGITHHGWYEAWTKAAAIARAALTEGTEG